MSSRAVRKLLKERGYDELSENAARIEETAEASGNESDDAGEKLNMFELLGGGDGGSDSGDDGSESNGEEEAKLPAKAETPPSAPKQPGSGVQNKKKGKKKKGKGKQKAATVDDMSMEEFEAQLKKMQEDSPARPDDEEERPRAGRGEALGVVLSDEQQQNRALLVVDPKFLDSEAEIRRVFGSAAVAAKDSSGRRRRGGLRARRLALSHPKATWPMMQGPAGVEMHGVDARAGDATGGSWFAIEHSERFRTVQLEFLGAVMTSNADVIAGLAHRYPYHVDALLQLSEILKQTGGDFGEAGALVERALFAFEQGFAPRFSATNGMGRLDFRRIESRGLFLALFRHMQFMARRGCWRTAFEVNKVLLGLDPASDPYGALMTLDFHALKSRQYEYVRQFARDWTWSDIGVLPNWAYSRALAEFHLGGHDSTDLLVDAILAFPTVVPQLWTSAGIDVDAVVLTHPYFQDMTIPDESAMTAMQLLVGLFVERNGSLYRLPEVGRWLQEGLLLALERIALGGNCASDIQASPALVKRMERAQKQLCTYVIPERISRHVLVADVEKLKAGLPQEIRSATSYAFDPLPPADDINIYGEIMGGAGEALLRDRMPGGFGDDLMAELDAVDGNPEAVEGLLERLRNLFGLGAGEADPGTSSDEDDAGGGAHGGPEN